MGKKIKGMIENINEVIKDSLFVITLMPVLLALWIIIKIGDIKQFYKNL